MATKRIVPRATGEGGIGRSDKLMGQSFFSESGLSNNVREYEATVTTTNATATTIWTSDVLSTGNALLVLAMVIGTSADGATVGSYQRKISVRCPASGAVVLGTTDLVGSDDEVGSTALNLTAGISGGALRLQVIGRASTTMTWRASIRAVWVR